jgi:hypothetical protein
MKNYTGRPMIFALATFIGLSIFAMQNSVAQVKTVLTADSLKSGNAKDVLTSFFQLAFDKLTGPTKELNFKSNPFAIMLKSNPELAVDTNYFRYRALRKTNFHIGLKLDSSYKFNGFSSGITYALIDDRDSSTSRILFHDLERDSLGREADQLQIKLVEVAMSLPIDQRKEFNNNIRAFFNRNAAFSTLPAAFQAQLKTIVNADPNAYPRISNFVNNKPSSNMFAEQRRVYDSLKNFIKKDLLWTISLSDTTYKNEFAFSNIVLKTQLLKGIGRAKAGSNWEFNILAAVNFRDDTLSLKRDLKRGILNFEPGFNWVARNKKNDQSFFEFSFSGSFLYNFGKTYNAQKRDSLMFNGTIRIRILGDIWIPLEFKYAPKSGNIFGFINLRANFSTLGKLAKGL